jgi:acyl-coenzyme A synthetase/AMP-(fatty) acid ligase
MLALYCGCKEQPGKAMLLIKQIMFRAREREDEPALASVGGAVSYRVLAMSVAAAVDRLQALSLQRGDLVLLQVTHPFLQVYLTVACALLGLPSASVPRGARPPFPGPPPRCVIVDEGAQAIEGAVVAGADWLQVDPRQPVDYARLLALPCCEPAKTARYLYSSGTTGHPRWVALSAELVERWARAVTIQDRVTLNLMGLPTISGYLGLLRALASGGLLCLADTPQAAADVMRLFRVGTLTASVGLLQAMLPSLEGKAPLMSVRLVRLMGARIPADLMQRARVVLPAEYTVIYGSTEVNVVASGLANGLRIAEGEVGYVVPGVGVEIVDEAGGPLPYETVGNIRIRPNGTAFYADEAGTVTGVADAAGWFVPGDLGRLSADGRLTIVGRTGDVINRGGAIVAPEAIEAVFRTDARIEDVAAVAIPQPTGIDEIWVAIVASQPIDLNSLVQGLKAQLGADKMPNRVIQLREIPRNENRKVRRNMLRDYLLQS